MHRKEFNGKKLNGNGSAHFLPLVIPIRTDDLTLHEIEAAILQVLALGRFASVDEAAIAGTLGALIEESAVTDWAQSFTAEYGFQWERRRLFQDLLFSLRGSLGRP